MSYQEKKTITSIVTGAAVLAAYCIYAFGKYQSGMVDASDLKFWAVTMLVFIGIGIVAIIVIQIVFYIVHAISIAVKERQCDEKEIEKSIEASVIEDEMDKLIELKSMRTGYIIAGIGFVSALVLLVLDFPPVWMINVIFLSCCVGSLAERFLSLYYYTKGVRNG